MPKKSLHDQITHLQQELRKVKSLSPQDQRQLKALDEQLNVTLSDADAADHDSLSDRLEESIAYLEADHPVLAKTITNLINALSNMGI